MDLQVFVGKVFVICANPHLPTRNLTLRYDGKIGFGAEVEPACVVDMSQDTTAICLPKGTTHKDLILLMNQVR